jgi:hypothetical protein
MLVKIREECMIISPKKWRRGERKERGNLHSEKNTNLNNFKMWVWYDSIHIKVCLNVLCKHMHVYICMCVWIEKCMHLSFPKKSLSLQ